MPGPQASSVVAAADFAGRAPFDTVILPHDGRYRRRITMRTEGDLVFLLDLPAAMHLKHGDGLLLDDGRIIGIEAAGEPVAEITARDTHHLARIAWHIGNRHVPAEILADRIRILPDHTIEDMVRGLGGRVEQVEARFEPEGGAYDHAAAHGHAHHQVHEHDDHRHGDHGHDGHGHDDHGLAHGHRHG